MIKSRKMRWTRHVAGMGRLVGKPERKRPLGRPKRRWLENIKIDLREIDLDCMAWMDVTLDRDQ
jgi:hypothetical protein